jgi:hypothetical protein
MSSLHFGLAVFSLLEARVPEFDKQPLPRAAVDSILCINSGTLASNWQNTSSPNYNDDISLLSNISHLCTWTPADLFIFGVKCVSSSTAGLSGCLEKRGFVRKQ